MEHSTLINGTVHEIIGGMAMVNGTTHEITGGGAMVNGTAYGIEFSKELEPVPEGKVGITIKTFDPPCGEISVNGESISISEEGRYVYESGATVSITGWACNIMFNGEMVAKINTAGDWCSHYTFALTENVTMYSNYGDDVAIYVETE